MNYFCLLCWFHYLICNFSFCLISTTYLLNENENAKSLFKVSMLIISLHKYLELLLSYVFFFAFLGTVCFPSRGFVRGYWQFRYSPSAWRFFYSQKWASKWRQTRKPNHVTKSIWGKPFISNIKYNAKIEYCFHFFYTFKCYFVFCDWFSVFYLFYAHSCECLEFIPFL